MHRANEIKDNNIGSYMVPEIQQRLNGQYGTSFTSDSIRAKYYALRELAKLYIAFKRREKGLGWDSQNFTWLMDDSKWAELARMTAPSTTCLRKFLSTKEQREISALALRTSLVLQPRRDTWRTLHDPHGEREGRTMRTRVLN
ncbi:unnamed protein product [Coffea canephora]|uniref:Myb/SANT-like domain-containing protein n=1 Tax=Coffea canephora TaxID=49390 RepID=A0A068V017_COFCA|nr:unnamed protein product [Coffea canephora]